MKKYRKILITTFKIILSVGLLYLVFSKIPFSHIWEQIKTSKFGFLILAFLALFVSQWLSAKRLLLYFQQAEFDLKENENLKLYFIGMFYNFFVPGGIGGDAYKVFILNKKYQWSVRKLSALILNDRLSGLLAIVLLILVFSWKIIPDEYSFAIPMVFILSLLIAYFTQKILFKSFLPVFFKSLVWSVLVQGFQLLCVWFLLKSIGSAQETIIYFLVFLISAVLSVLSFSGIGVREWFFLKSAEFFTFDSSISVALALLFSFITALIALLGIYYQFNKNQE